MEIPSHRFLCASTLFTVAVATSYFIPIAQHWQATPVYLRHHGYVLLNHVIKTLNVFFAECLEACQENMHCFSFNYIKLSGGVFRCQLNRSNKNQSSKSYVPKPDWQYVEPKEKKACHQDNCTKTEALSDGWYRLGGSKCKLIRKTETWQDAQKHCQSLGGSLLSVTNELTALFFTGLFELRSTLAKYTLDGTDDNLSLGNEAAIETVGDTKALYLNGLNRARVPKIDFRKTDFTMAIWIKCSDGSGFHRVLSNSPSSNIILAIVKGSLQINFRFQDGSLDSSTFSINSYLEYWFHVAVTWNRDTRHINIYVNGTHMDNITAVSSNLRKTNSDFTFGRGQRGSWKYKGWLREFLVIPIEIGLLQINLIKEEKMYFGGVWTGLNDSTTEGAFKLPNEGQAVNIPSIASNKDQNDCVMLMKRESGSAMLKAANCLARKEFICELSL